MISTNLTRSKAFFSHLTLSLIILAVLLYLLTQHWYPGVFFHLDGGWDGLKIVFGCDIVLGPVLTLVVFKPGKKTLWFDLTCIALVQTCALIAGTWIVYKERPLALVFENNRFYSLSHSNYTFKKIEVPNLNHFPGPTPKQIFISLPEDATARSQLLSQYRETQKLLRTDINFYEPLAPNWAKVIAWGGITVNEMINQFPKGQAEIEAWLQENNRTADNTVLIPISAAATWRFLYVDKTEPKILGITSQAIKPGL